MIKINISNEEIIEKYSDLVYRIAFSHVKSKADSEDIFQDVFISLVKNTHKIENEEHLKHWLIRATINRAKSFYLSFIRKKICTLDENYIDTSMNLEDRLTADAIRNEILALPKKLKSIVYLFYYEGYTISEISQILQIAEGTVKSRLHSARSTLKPKLMEVCSNEK